jgi:phosphate:Na+ symporter
MRDRSKTTAQQTSPLDLMRDIKRLNDHLVAGAAYPVLEATGDLMPSRIAENNSDVGSD